MDLIDCIKIQEDSRIPTMRFDLTEKEIPCAQDRYATRYLMTLMIRQHRVIHAPAEMNERAYINMLHEYKKDMMADIHRELYADGLTMLSRVISNLRNHEYREAERCCNEMISIIYGTKT